MATGRTVEELLEQLIEVTQGGPSRGRADGVDLGEMDLAKFKQQVLMSTDHMKKSMVEEKKGVMFLKGQQRTAVDITKTLEALDDQLKALDKQMAESADNAGNHDKINKKRAIEEQKDDIKSAAKRQMIGAASHNFALGLGDVTKSMATGVANLVKGLQSSASGVDVGSQVLLDGVDTTNKAVGVVGSLASAAGAGLIALGKGKLRWVGFALEILGVGAGVAADYLSKLSKEGIKYFQTELTNTIETFTAANRAGALYADGMTGVRNAAFDAGMTMKQFGAVVTDNSATLAGLGLSVAEGAKKMGAAMRAGGAEFTKNLRNLGYSVEEQAAMVAQTMKDMRGNAPLKATDTQIAEQTQKYAENLRLIAAITGEDAKKKMEEAREAVAELGFQQKLGNIGEIERANIQNMMGTLDAQGKKNLKEQVVFGLVINQVGAVQNALVPALGKTIKEMADTINNGTASTAKGYEIQAKYSDQIKKELMAPTGVGAAGMASTGGVVGDAATAMGKSLETARRLTQEAVAAGKFQVKSQKETDDKLTKSVTDLETARQNMAVELGKLTNTALPNFANGLNIALGTIEDRVKRFGINDMKAGKDEKKDDSFFRAPSAGEVKTITTLLGGIIGGGGAGILTGGTAAIPGAIGGAAVGQTAGEMISEFFNLKKGFAGGGIAEGPTSGYIEKLHGTEAVVPLSNQKSIPVTLNDKSSSMASKTPDANFEDIKQIIKTVIPPVGVISKAVEVFTKQTISLNNADYKEGGKFWEAASNNSGQGGKGMTAFGVNEWEGYNMGPLTTDLKALKDIAAELGAFDKATQLITDPATWKQILNSGIATNYDLGAVKVGTETAPGIGDILGKMVKELTESGKADTTTALKEVTAQFRLALLESHLATGDMGKIVNMLTEADALPEIPKEFQATFNDYMKSNKDDAAVARFFDKELTRGITDLQTGFANSNREVAQLMASRFSGEAGEEIPRGATDLQTRFENTSKEIAHLMKSRNSFDDNGLTDNDITQMIGKLTGAIPPVDMISKAIDFFIKSDTKKESVFGDADLDKQMQPLIDRVAAIPDRRDFLESNKSMPTNNMARPNFDTAGLDEAMSPKMTAIYKSMADSLEATKKATDSTDNLDPGTGMGPGRDSKSNANSDLLDSLKELPNLLKAMINSSDEQLQELRATKNIQQQIANNY